MNQAILPQWLAFADTLLWQDGYLDASSYNAFLRAASLGIQVAVAIEQVAIRIAGAAKPQSGER